MNFYNIFSEIILNSNISTELQKIGIYSLSKKQFEEKLRMVIKNNIEETIEKITDILSKKPLVINSNWKILDETPMIKIEYKMYRKEYQFQILPTESIIQETSILMNMAMREEFQQRFKKLTQPQTELFIDNILGDPKLKWIKNFKLSPTKNNDGGIDFTALLLISENREDIGWNGFGKMIKIVGQLKHHKNPIQPDKIREFIGTMETSKTKFGIFVSTNGYTKKAIIQSQESKYKIFCWDAMYIAKIMIKHGIGVKSIKLKNRLIQNDEDWWNEIQNIS